MFLVRFAFSRLAAESNRRESNFRSGKGAQLLRIDRNQTRTRLFAMLANDGAQSASFSAFGQLWSDLDQFWASVASLTARSSTNFHGRVVRDGGTVDVELDDADGGGHLWRASIQMRPPLQVTGNPLGGEPCAGIDSDETSASVDGNTVAAERVGRARTTTYRPKEWLRSMSFSPVPEERAHV